MLLGMSEGARMNVNYNGILIAVLIARGYNQRMYGRAGISPAAADGGPPCMGGVSKIPADQPYVATAQPADLTQWWGQFNDPILNELVEEAVKNNLDLKLPRQSCVRPVPYAA